MDKLKSRKFWLTLITTLSGIATALTSVGGDIGVVAGMVVAVLTTIIYVITEGKIDAKALGMMAEDASQIMEGIEDLRNNSKEETDVDDV